MSTSENLCATGVRIKGPEQFFCTFHCLIMSMAGCKKKVCKCLDLEAFEGGLREGSYIGYIPWESLPK